MIEGLKPYPKMKDSGVPWLGRVPEHWNLRKLRSMLQRVTERGRPDLPLLSVVRDKGVVLRDVSDRDENHNFIPDDLTNYKVVRAGQFAMNKMKAWQGSYGVSKHDGIVSPAYFVFDLNGAIASFFHTAIRSRAYIPSFTQSSDGVRVGQWDLVEPRMREIRFFVPPASEQECAVRFLSHADRRIRRLIRSKQRLVTLLEEQKQAIIQRAVTRGLDPNVRLEESGIDWIGAIPQHWETHRIGRLFAERNATGMPYLPILMVTIGHGITVGQEVDDDGKPKRLIEDRSKYKVALQGDIAYNTMRMWQGAVGMSPTDGLVSPAYVVARPRPGVNPEYFVSLFRTAACKSEVVSRSRGIVDDRNRLYWDQFKDIAVPVPPAHEQTQIVNYLAEQLRGHNDAHRTALDSISVLRELRTRLISDVVTGKLDVREAAARLPEESIDGDDPFDDTDTDGEESDDSAAGSGLEDGDGG